jgi:hypothetical protein
MINRHRNPECGEFFSTALQVLGLFLSKKKVLGLFGRRVMFYEFLGFSSYFY